VPSLEVSKNKFRFLGNFRPFALEDTRRARRNAAIAMGANPKLSRSNPTTGATDLGSLRKQRNDSEPDRWMSEIRLRAIAQIGNISRELSYQCLSQACVSPPPGPQPMISIAPSRWSLNLSQKPSEGEVIVRHFASPLLYDE
jgi:hypothetical protein